MAIEQKPGDGAKVTLATLEQAEPPPPPDPPLANQLFIRSYATAVAGAVIVLLSSLLLPTSIVFVISAAWLLVAVAIVRINLGGATTDLEALAEAADGFLAGRYTTIDVAALGGSQEVNSLRDLLLHAQKQVSDIDSRDRRFLMSVSHELRTPLTAIAGHAQALQEGLAEDPEVRDRSLEVIQRETGRLERLVGDIIDLARLRSNRFATTSEGVELTDLGAHLMALFRDADTGDITVSGEFDDVFFQSDGERILQILRNLVGNALRYATSHVTVTGREHGRQVIFTVDNDGPDIDPELAERLFEPFVGTKREGGMGLGLAISRELAWALGGEMSLTRTDGGATFELSLPLEPPGSGR